MQSNALNINIRPHLPDAADKATITIPPRTAIPPSIYFYADA